MSDINIKVIGCGDAFGSGGRAQTCFYVFTKNCSFLIDCGATSVSALKSYKVNVAELDYIVISHLHGDHFGGLPFIILDSILNSRKSVLQILGPPDLEERTWQLFRLLYPGTEEKIDKSYFLFKHYNTLEELKTEHFEIMPYPVIHSKQSHPHGVRIKLNDKIISYSGDTEWCESLPKLSANADIFICECSYLDVKGHLNYQTLITKLPFLSFKNILLTHLDEELIQQGDSLKLPCAYDGMELLIQ